MAPESKVVTSVAMTTVVAMGEIHLRPEMSATVSSASIETMTMSSGPVRPVDVGRVSTSVTKPPLPDWTRMARTMTRMPPTTAAPRAWISCIGRRRTSRSAPTPIGRSSTPMPLIQPRSVSSSRGRPLVASVRSCSTAPRVPAARSATSSPSTSSSDRGGQAHSVGGTADPLGDGWLDDLHVRRGSRTALVGGLSGSHPQLVGPGRAGRARAPPFGAWSPPWCRPTAGQVASRPRPWGAASSPSRRAWANPARGEARFVAASPSGACRPVRETPASGARLTP